MIVLLSAYEHVSVTWFQSVKFDWNGDVMTKIIIIISKINCCNDCPHMYEKMDSREYACDNTKTYNKIRDIYTIPKWCKLKDYEVKNEL